MSTSGLLSPKLLRALATPVKLATSLNEPIQEDEMIAFQQALLATSAHDPSPGGARSRVKTRGGFRSSNQLNDFADTETAGSASALALSNTQYDDLN